MREGTTRQTAAHGHRPRDMQKPSGTSRSRGRNHGPCPLGIRRCSLLCVRSNRCCSRPLEGRSGRQWAMQVKVHKQVARPRTTPLVLAVESSHFNSVSPCEAGADRTTSDRAAALHAHVGSRGEPGRRRATTRARRLGSLTSPTPARREARAALGRTCTAQPGQIGARRPQPKRLKNAASSGCD